jgi:hypothetical protein
MQKIRIEEKANSFLFFKNKEEIGKVTRTPSLWNTIFKLFVNDQPVIGLIEKAFTNHTELKYFTWIPEKLEYRNKLKKQELLVNNDVFRFETKGYMKSEYRIFKNDELYAELIEDSYFINALDHDMTFYIEDDHFLYVLFIFCANLPIPV